MNRRQDFAAQIARLRRRVFFRNLSNALGVAVAAFLACRAGALALEKGGWLHPGTATAFYPMAAGVTLAIAALYAIWGRQRLLGILIDLDQRLQLQERLSTAYEYRQQGGAPELTKLLLADAANQLNRLDRGEVLPRKFKASDGVLVAVIVANLTLPFLPPWGTLVPPVDVGPKSPELAARQQPDPTANPAAESRPPTGAPPTLPDAELRASQAQSLRPTPVYPALNRLRPNVRGAYPRSNPDDRPSMESPNQGRSVSVPVPAPQMKSLEALDTASGQPGGVAWLENLPPHTSESEETTATAYRRAKAWQESRREPPPAAGPDGQGSDTGAAADNSAGEERTLRGAGFDARRRHTPAPATGVPDREGLPGTGNAPGEGGQGTADQADPPAGETPGQGPGHGKSAERPRALRAIDTLPGPAVQEPSGAAAAVWTRIPVRALTTAGKARVTEEAAARPYRRELESVLRKEAIPLNYRQYIRNYFLAIGLQEE